MKMKKGYVPELRFPEFQNDAGWDIATVGSKAIKIGSGITPKGGDKNYKKSGRPFIRSQNIGWGHLILDDVAFIDDDTHSTFSSTEIKANDVLLNITGASIGRSAVADSGIQGGNVNQHVCIIRTKKSELKPYFLNQYLLSSDGQKQIDSFQAGGNRQGLNFAQIRSFSFLLPSVKEQQKIADCLSCLDSVISLQAQKVDALQQYKKGLMQHLFPADGETLPKLRFGKFAGDWNIRNLGELVSIKTGKKNTQDKVPDGKYPFFVRSQHVESIDTYSFDGEAILTAGDGVGVGKVFHYINGKFDYHQRVYCLSDFRSFAYGKYIYEVFKNNFGVETAKYSAKNSVDSVRMEMITGMKIPLPSLSEQQKIADCLASLDELIVAETHKLAALKTHKTGLMQQLFPTMDEING
ncbi:restriction endonuclease subunit S [Citrobacter portucalensis]|nr:restriction endonuclease subunit S [Citrobacter portucalensis]MCX9031248.1 restriction endonuclease subunit S [Citrobacter portucalensis]